MGELEDALQYACVIPIDCAILHLLSSIAQRTVLEAFETWDTNKVQHVVSRTDINRSYLDLEPVCRSIDFAFLGIAGRQPQGGDS